MVEEKEEFEMGLPNGVGEQMLAHAYEKFDIKGGSDALVAAFNQDTYDIIVAPTNLGVKFYNLNKIINHRVEPFLVSTVYLKSQLVF